ETSRIGFGTVICPGDVATIGVEATGGNGTVFQYQWDPDVTWFSSIELYPDVTISYAITTTDNCSEPVNDTINVFVYEPFSAVIETSDPMCYGSIGFAEATAVPSEPSGYSYQWNSAPPNFTNTIYGPVATRYELTITRNEGECVFDTSITIPFFPNVTANFTPNPNGACLKESDPVAEFIDLSDGAFSGYWDFGDGATEDYVFGNYPTHEYPDTGVYTVTLYVENELATCTDEYSFDVCVQPEFKLWIPDAFTPDGDGLNDVLEIVSSGMIEFEFIILSRWGAPIFRMNSIDDPFWDGTFKGNPVPQDQYAYEVVAKGNHIGGVKFQKSSGYIFVYRH
ncbi:MAG: gliding motility-associated C-terminal domain-containing protein, partial [Flavobacteriales bacterium]|nr:gliding motility-associated C-terminal domain-containing protein [Flavobacteriales bacterium]